MNDYVSRSTPFPWKHIFSMEKHIFHRNTYFPWKHIFHGNIFSMETHIFHGNIFHGKTYFPQKHIFHGNIFFMETNIFHGDIFSMETHIFHGNIFFTYLRSQQLFVKIVSSEFLDFWDMGHFLAAHQVVLFGPRPLLQIKNIHFKYCAIILAVRYTTELFSHLRPWEPVHNKGYHSVT